MQEDKFYHIISFIKSLFPHQLIIPLHEPRFIGNEREYVLDAIDSTFVSSVGAYVDKLEEMMKVITGAKFAVATVNGTAALHVAILLAGVKPGNEVITQPLTFIATANAISYVGATPVFVDVDKETLGMSPIKLETFLHQFAEVRNDECYNKATGKKIAACVPMHTFGFPLRIDEIIAVCNQYHIPVVEDAAESLGSSYKQKHTGSFGLLGTFSFNGNKTVTCGGGGAIVTNDSALGKLAKHITTTAKAPHKWEYVHDMIAYNYRMPNLNAALGVAQLEQLDKFLTAKRNLAEKYKNFFAETGIRFMEEPINSYSNYWLNSILLHNRDERDEFLKYTNQNGVMTRPAWRLMNQLPMFKDFQCGNLANAEWIADRLVNIPSSAII